MYEFQHTQLSLLREAISRRGQCTDALVSNTSSVAYTYRIRLIRLNTNPGNLPVPVACSPNLQLWRGSEASGRPGHCKEALHAG